MSGFSYNSHSAESPTLDSSSLTSALPVDLNFETNVETGKLAANNFSSKNFETEFLDLSTEGVIEINGEISNSNQVGFVSSTVDSTTQNSDEVYGPPVPPGFRQQSNNASSQSPSTPQQQATNSQSSAENDVELNWWQRTGAALGTSIANLVLKASEGVGTFFESMVIDLPFSMAKLPITALGRVCDWVMSAAYDYLDFGEYDKDIAGAISDAFDSVIGQERVKGVFGATYELTDKYAWEWAKSDSFVPSAISSVSYYVGQALLIYVTGGISGEAALAKAIISAISRFAKSYPKVEKIMKESKIQDAVEESLKDTVITQAMIDAKRAEILAENPDADISNITIVALLKQDIYDRAYRKVSNDMEFSFVNEIEVLGFTICEAAVEYIFSVVSDQYKESLEMARKQLAGAGGTLAAKALDTLKVTLVRSLKTYINDRLESLLDGEVTFEEFSEAVMDYITSVIGSYVVELGGMVVTKDYIKYGVFNDSTMKALGPTLDGDEALRNDVISELSQGKTSNEDITSTILADMYKILKNAKIDPATLTKKTATETINGLLSEFKSLLNPDVDPVDLIKWVYAYNE